MIYFVDDEKGFLDNVKMIFKGKPNVKFFDFPNDALMAIAKEPPDVLVSDVLMPQKIEQGSLPQGMDGLNFCKIVTSIAPATEIIVLSANSKEHIEGLYPNLLQNFKHFFQKPLKSETIDFILKLESESNHKTFSVVLSKANISKLKRYPGNTVEEKLAALIDEKMNEIP